MVVNQVRVVLVLLLLMAATVATPQMTQSSHILAFDGENAMDYLVQQCDFGPRPPGSDNLTQCKTYIAATLESFGWNVTLQNFTYLEVECSNIIATWPDAEQPSYVLGAHYDTRPRADQDPEPANRMTPIIGANDGASGVAVLLELASGLPAGVRNSVEIVLFDAEDSGYINGWDWIVGSTYYVDQLSPTRVSEISAMILLDIVGDSDLRLERETSSTRSLQDLIWSIADEMGHNDTFLDVSGRSILDDHRPFLDVGIPSVDIIQHNGFPWYWHTLEDTPDKCSAESLQIVGEVVETFLIDYANDNLTLPLDENSLFYLSLLIVPVAVIVLVHLYLKRK
ncbi:MAG: M28 family peptidase [Candidatus Thorarchaeota archaeon]|nr:M28 family peptidase [Candidatus Thorarchaeota archaeon]